MLCNYLLHCNWTTIYSLGALLHIYIQKIHILPINWYQWLCTLKGADSADSSFNFTIQQECIPVGCVPPAHWLYLIISYACPPRKNHACPPAPRKNHACPPRSNHAPPQEKPCLPPWKKPCTPPGKTTHTPLEKTMHTPQKKPHTPPGATTHPPPPLPGATTPPLCGQTDTCKNITFANFVCGR